MNTKESVVRVKQEAHKLSEQFPDCPYYVMDKRGKRAVCHSMDWMVRERILSGYHVVCCYKGGVEYTGFGIEERR